jgi:hypothetical protein
MAAADPPSSLRSGGRSPLNASIVIRTVMDAAFVDLAARYVVGDVFVDDLPAAAVDALVRGFDSLSLALLAGASSREDPAEVWSLFLAVLAELRIPLPVRGSAAELLKVSYARKVLTGAWTPRTAALKFVHLHQVVATEIADQQYVGDGLDIVAMIRAHYSYDDLVNVPDQEGIDRMVVLECHRLVGSSRGSAG